MENSPSKILSSKISFSENLSKERKADLIFTCFLVGAAFLGITITSFVFAQELYMIVPLYFSLGIMLLQSRANKYTFLLGGLNSVLYSAIYFHLKVYGVAATTFFVSMPFQLITFFRWKKHSDGNVTELKTLGLKKRLVLAAVFAVCWVLAYIVLSFFGSNYILFDNTLFLMSLVTSTLSVLCYLDFAYISCVSVFINICLAACMMREHPIQLTYLIYNVYALICCIRSVIRMSRIYKEQEQKRKLAVC